MSGYRGLVSWCRIYRIGQWFEVETEMTIECGLWLHNSGSNSTSPEVRFVKYFQEMAFGVVSDHRYRQILQADLVFWSNGFIFGLIGLIGVEK